MQNSLLNKLGLILLTATLTLSIARIEKPVSPRINHVYLSVSDLERSIAFYTNAFDLSVTNRLTKLKVTTENGVQEREVKMAFLKFKDQDFILELGEVANFSSDNSSSSYAHIGIDVKNIEKESERLLKAGASALRPIATVEAEGVKAKNSFFSGPDGEVLELMQLISGEF